MRPQVHRHVMRELVDPGLLRAIRRPMHIAIGAKRRGKHNQPATLRRHHRRRMPARHVARPQANFQDPGHFQRLLPERPRHDQLVMQEGGVVDQDIEPAGFLAYAAEQRLDLLVVAVIAGHSNAAAAERVDLLRSGVDRARQRRAAFLLGAPGDIHGGACRAERQCNAPSGAARCAGHHGNARLS
ncbi:hypothetical protein D3C81_1204470 [compost metagenome]